MKREIHKPLEMIHAEWHDVKKEDKETRVKWLIKHQKMMLPYDINWEKLIECNRTGKWFLLLQNQNQLNYLRDMKNFTKKLWQMM